MALIFLFFHRLNYSFHGLTIFHHFSIGENTELHEGVWQQIFDKPAAIDEGVDLEDRHDKFGRDKHGLIWVVKQVYDSECLIAKRQETPSDAHWDSQLNALKHGLMPLLCIWRISKQKLMLAQTGILLVTDKEPIVGLYAREASFMLQEELLVEVIWHRQIIVWTEQVLILHSLVKRECFRFAQRRWNTLILIFLLVILDYFLVLAVIKEHFRLKQALDAIQIPLDVPEENYCANDREEQSEIHQVTGFEYKISVPDVDLKAFRCSEQHSNCDNRKSDEKTQEIVLDDLLRGLTELHREVLSVIEVFCKEGFCYCWQMRRINEMCTVDQVLNLSDQFHGNFHSRVTTFLVIQPLILLLFHLQVFDVCSLLFDGSPGLNLFLSSAHENQTADIPANDSCYAAHYGYFQCVSLVRNNTNAEKRTDNRGREQRK